ncbi:hypothetical protein EON71_00425 [bacterium]|nr:MAG: hypothetical protein EON71_00425 [bacterium]
MKKVKYTYTWDPFPYLPLSTHKYYHILRSSIQNIQEIIEENKNKKHITFALRMLQDSYIPLTLIYNGLSKNVEVNRECIISIEECSDIFIDQNNINMKPNIRYSFHGGLLPDATHLLYYCNFWRNMKKRKILSFEEVMIYMFSKVTPWRCQNRSLSKTIVKDCFQRHEKMYDLVLSFLTCSMLGGYEHCNEYPSFGERCLIYDWMIARPIDKKIMITWFQTKENQPIIEYTCREYLLHLTNLVPSLRHNIVLRYKWDEIENSTISALDAFRKYIRENAGLKGSYTEWFATARHILKKIDISKRLKMKNNIPNPILFCHKMSNVFKKVDEIRILEKNIVTTELNVEEDKCIKDLIDIYAPKYELPLFILTETPIVAQKYISHDLTSGVFNKYRNPFAISSRVLDDLCNLIYDFYEERDFKQLSTFISSLSPYTYQKIRSFFTHLSDKYSVVIHQLPMHQYISQLKAMCKKYNKSRPKDLPSTAGVYYYSNSCGFKGSLVPLSNDKKIKSSCLNSFGSFNCTYSFEDDNVFCDHKKTNKSRRKNVSPSQHLEKDYIENTANTNVRSKCKNEICHAINMIGIVLEINNDFISLCNRCANPATYHPTRFHFGLFLCGKCSDDSENDFCVICHTTITKSRRRRQFSTKEVLDNSTDDIVLKQIWLCSSCIKKHKIDENENLPTLSSFLKLQDT